MFNNCFSEIRALYDIMWKTVVQPDRPQMTQRYSPQKIRLVCRINKRRFTDQLIIFITYCISTAIMVRERVSQLRLTYTARRTQCSIKKPHNGCPGIEPEPRRKPSGLYQDLTNRLYEEACFENLEVTHSTNIRLSRNPTIDVFIHNSSRHLRTTTSLKSFKKRK
jgi:hypothetical protein